MLTKDPAERAQLMILSFQVLASENQLARGISVDEALSHPWLREQTEAADSFGLKVWPCSPSAVLLPFWPAVGRIHFNPNFQT